MRCATARYSKAKNSKLEEDRSQDVNSTSPDIKTTQVTIGPLFTMLTKLTIVLLVAHAFAGNLPAGVRDWKEFASMGEEERLLEDQKSPQAPTYQSPSYGYNPTWPPMSAPVQKYDKPVYESPVYYEPAPKTEKPIYESPVYYEPTPKTEKPAYESPVYYEPTKREDFEKECHDNLLSKDVTWDELISQHEFAAFLTSYCISEFVCDKGDELEFVMLPTLVVLAFAVPVCANEPLCLIEAEEEFGFVYNKASKDLAETQITEMCNSLFPLLVDFVAHTPGK